MVRKVNKSLKDWVNFIKKVQKEENITYREAMMRAKTRKNKGEKWQSGGNSLLGNPPPPPSPPSPPSGSTPPGLAPPSGSTPPGLAPPLNNATKMGGRRPRKQTAKKQKGGRKTRCKQNK